MAINDFVSSKDKFTLDGVSSDALGLRCDYLSPMPLAEQKYTDFNVGADETGTTPDEVFNDITYNINFFKFYPDDFNDSAIKAFCFNKKILTLSRFPDYYFKIKKIRLAAVGGIVKDKRIDYTLSLVIAPFKYVANNLWVTLSSNDDSIVNDHTRYSKPDFEITGTGNITLTVNGLDFTVEGLTNNQTIIIDSSRHQTYSGTTLLTGKTNGHYPLFGIGSNAISWTGNITSIKYRANWRDL